MPKFTQTKVLANPCRNLKCHSTLKNNSAKFNAVIGVPCDLWFYYLPQINESKCIFEELFIKVPRALLKVDKIQDNFNACWQVKG